MVCQFLLYNKVNQLYIYICPHITSLLHLPPTLPIPPLQVVTKHRADLPVLCGCFPLAIYFTFGSVYMSMPLSHFVPAYPSPSPCPQVHSLRLRLFFLFFEFLNFILFIFLYSRSLLVINFIHISVYMSINVCIFIPVLPLGSSEPFFFQIPYICVSIWYLFFSF